MIESWNGSRTPVIGPPTRLCRALFKAAAVGRTSKRAKGSMRPAVISAMCSIVVLLWAVVALAQERIALVIGNRDYREAVGPLQNPINDMKAVGEALRSIGFSVQTIENADY